MTHGRETVETDEKAEAHNGFDLSQLWLLPLLILAQVLALFSNHADQLKAMRPRVRAMPEAWTGVIPDLLRVEWQIRWLTASGVAILRSGQALDLRDLLGAKIEAMPPGYQIPLPRSAWQAHRRMEAIARFHADPEAFIHRQAQRLAQRIAAAKARRVQSLDLDPADPVDLSSSGSGRSGGGGGGGGDGASVQSAPHPGPGIRAPPGAGVFLSKCPHPTRSRWLRDREIMPETIADLAAWRNRPPAADRSIFSPTKIELQVLRNLTRHVQHAMQPFICRSFSVAQSPSP